MPDFIRFYPLYRRCAGRAVVVLLAAWLGGGSLAGAQTPNFEVKKLGQITSSTWQTLRDVKFKKQQGGLYTPVFGPKVLAAEGQEVELQGYVVPIEEGRFHKHFLLTSLPVSACFFCGVGGPETVAEVYGRLPIRYTDRVIRLRGILALNADDPDAMLYVLKNASVVE